MQQMRTLDQHAAHFNRGITLPPENATFRGYWGFHFRGNVDGVGMLVSEGDHMLNRSRPAKMNWKASGRDGEFSKQVHWASANRRREVIKTLSGMAQRSSTLKENFEKVLMFMLYEAGVSVQYSAAKPLPTRTRGRRR